MCHTSHSLFFNLIKSKYDVLKFSKILGGYIFPLRSFLFHNRFKAEKNSLSVYNG